MVSHTLNCWILTRIISQVESALIVSPYVDNIMLHADPFHSYCVALVVAAPQAIEYWARSKGITFSDFAELCRKEETVKEVHASLVKVCVTVNKLIVHVSCLEIGNTNEL